MKWTNASVRFGTQMKTLCGPYGLQSQQQSDMKGAFCGSQWFTFLSRLNFSCFFVCDFFLTLGLTKKSLAADKSKITHSNRRLPNIVRIDKYTANTFLKKKEKNGKNLAVSTQSCPYTVHYGDMSLFFPFIDSRCRVTQRNANWPSVVCCVLCQKRKRWQFEQSYMILFVFWFSVRHMPRWRPQSYKGMGGRGAGKGNHWKFKAFFFFFSM